MPPIKQENIIDKSVQKAFEDLNKAIEVTLKQLDKLLEDGKQIQSTFSNAGGIKDYTSALDKLSKQRKEASQLSKDQIELLKKEEQLNREVERTAQLKRKGQIAEQKETDRLVRLQEKKLKQSARLTSSYSKLSKELTETRNKTKDLAADLLIANKKFGENSKQCGYLS